MHGGVCGGVCFGDHVQGRELDGDRDLGLQGPQEVRDQRPGEVENIFYCDLLFKEIILKKNPF